MRKQIYASLGMQIIRPPTKGGFYPKSIKIKINK